MSRLAAILLLLLAPLAATAALRVEIDGLDGAPLENVRRLVAIVGEEGRAPSAARLRRLHRDAPREIREALEPFGRYRPTIDGELRREGEGWLARYRIDPGPPLPVTRLDLTVDGPAAADPAFRALLADPPLQEGDTLDHRRYDELKNRLRDLAARRGYLDARLDRHEIRLDLEHYRAEVLLHLAAGPRYRFGPTRFEQSEALFAPEFLARYLPYREGDPYDAARLVELEEALRDSDYFSEVEARPERDRTAAGAVPVAVRLTPRAAAKYGVGLGYGTDSGVRASLLWERRRLNDAGHRFDAEARLAQVGGEAKATYTIPGAAPRTDRLALFADLKQERTDSADSASFQLGATQRVEREGWREERSLSYLRERSTVAGVEESAGLVIPAIAWQRSWGADPVYTRDGLRLGLELRGAAAPLLSDLSFFQAVGRGKWIVPVGDEDRLLLRSEIGTTLTDRFDRLPASLRFFAGGDQSVRGYAYKELGPRDAGDRVVGGRNLLVGSVEYEHRLAERWSGALFLDAGNAVDGFHDPLEEGAGFGLRWHSPVGLVRVDLASALSQPGQPWRLHLTIGPDL